MKTISVVSMLYRGTLLEAYLIYDGESLIELTPEALKTALVENKYYCSTLTVIGDRLKGYQPLELPLLDYIERFVVTLQEVMTKRGGRVVIASACTDSTRVACSLPASSVTVIFTITKNEQFIMQSITSSEVKVPIFMSMDSTRGDLPFYRLPVKVDTLVNYFIKVCDHPRAKNMYCNISRQVLVYK